jgi:hypothetical protein
MKQQKSKPTGFRGELYGLAAYKPLEKLYHGRIATAVRDKLRAEFGDSRVRVPCHTDLIDSKWHGRCKIDGSEYEYQVFVESGCTKPILWIPDLEGVKSRFGG